MNLLSLMRHDYKMGCIYAAEAPGYQLTLWCEPVNDSDGYRKLSKIDIETLRDNAKRLYEACNNALPEEERT